MESLSSDKKILALNNLKNIENAILKLKQRNVSIHFAEDYLSSAEGQEKLDAACMVIEAIGESFKNLDKLTDYKLLPLYPSIEWKAVKGVRDVIAHRYFDIDAYEIFNIIDNDIDSIYEATLYFMDILKEWIFPQSLQTIWFGK